MPLFLPDPTYASLQALQRRRRSRLWVPPGTSGPPPPVSFLDDLFTDTDGTLLTAHTPSPTGGAWSSQAGGGGGTFAVNSNRAYGTSAGIMVNSAAPGSADYEVAAQLVPLSVDHNTSWGVVGRADPASYTAYVAFIYGWSGSFSLLLSLFVSGGYANLGSAALPVQPTLGSSHQIRLRMIGTAISVYYDSALLIPPVAEGTITAAGRAGLLLGTSTTASGVHIDSITAT